MGVLRQWLTIHFRKILTLLLRKIEKPTKILITFFL